MWNLKNRTSEYSKKKRRRRRRRAESQIQRTKLMVTRGGRGGAGQDRAGEVESTKYWV